MPEINFKNDAGAADNHITVTEDVDQEYKFEAPQLSAMDATMEIPPEPIAFMHYSRSYKKIIMGTT